MTINDRSAIALRPPFDWYGSKDYTICARQKAFALLLMIELIWMLHKFPRESHH